ncbi:OLC1v1029455C1 [Oldenlandia corymbosa var. corymbosa]|uniref:OLC1v1029455C1 n=1 Tax=Oldenlandia corymbosa var. corymbosa TaxID=529605 RepID=A0AAV1CEQ3_OLDCO|nr:OLC1v1029455C1 [Oldenlandia corymbosa var. corymbosa]
MEPTRDWSSLMKEMLEEIAARIPIVEDLMSFIGVCTSWRNAAALTTKDKLLKSASGTIPLLILSDKGHEGGGDEREFYSLYKRKSKFCMDVNFGWLLTVADFGDLCLLNPLSRTQIQLPNLKTIPDYEDYECATAFLFVARAILSANPSRTSDFVLTVLLGAGRFLCIWRPNDSTWTLTKSPGMLFSDVQYYDGKIYAFDFMGRVWIWTTCDDDDKVAKVVLTITHPQLFEVMDEGYLVESSSRAGELLVVTRDGNCAEKDGSYGATRFEVFRLDVTKCEWEKISSLGNGAIFVGHSAAISVDASAFPNVLKSNCIYFTDDCQESYWNRDGGGRDMGI